MSIPPSQYPESFKEPIFVNFCQNQSSPYEEVQHFHADHYELCFVMKGSVDYYFDFEQYTLNENTAIFLNKKMPHLSTEHPNSECQRIIINFNDKFLRDQSLNYHFLTEIFKSPVSTVRIISAMCSKI